MGWAAATKRRPWIRGGGIVIVGAIITGSIFWTGQATHDDELTAARTAVSALEKGEILQRKASIDLQTALDAAHTETGVLAGIVTDGAAYSSQDTITALDTTMQTLVRDIGTYIPEGAAAPVVPEPETATVTRIIPSNWNTAHIHTVRATLERATAAVSKNTRKLTAATKQLAVLTDETNRTLVDVAETSPCRSGSACRDAAVRGPTLSGYLAGGTHRPASRYRHAWPCDA
ncbi:hypothetical protein [Plantibacter sp. RU18]|uniref:hypothetical protein n=1 Tax=Plantibacter sp. RU18 TaxID=3158143 RepID=UPI003D368A72